MSNWLLSIGELISVTVFGGILVASSFCVVASRRTSLKRNGIKFEVHGANQIDDLIIESVWRITVSMTNRSRRPRRVALLASRATVSAGRNVFLARVFIERNCYELSPTEVMIADIDCVLPAGLSPRRIALEDLDARKAIRLSTARSRRVLTSDRSSVAA